MADELTPDPPDDDEAQVGARVAALLGDPLTWAESDPGSEESIVAAVSAAAEAEAEADGPAPMPDPERSTDGGQVVPLSTARRWVAPFLAGAATVLLVVGAVALLGDSGGDDADVVAVGLQGTSEAPGATATAEVAATPLGTRIELSVEGLPPAPEGTYYEAWLRQGPDVGVSAGTFHLRGGDGSIELWAGVDLDDYPLVSVTLQDEGGGAESSGVVVLRGRSG